MRIELIRDGTFGRMVLPSGEILYTVERPWEDNRRSRSCVSPGEYPLRPTRYNRGGYDAYEVCGVEDRSRILVHVANWPHDVIGCVGVGTGVAALDGRPAVTGSRRAFARFMETLDGREAEIVIRNARGER